MHIIRTHNLGKAEARRRIEGLANYWRSKYGVRVIWHEDHAQLSGRVKGISFDANLVVGENTVLANASDPGWLLRTKVREYVGDKLDEHLNT